MKELLRFSKNIFESVPVEFRDWATVRITEYYLQSGIGHGFRTNKGRYWGHKMMSRWIEGKPTLLSEFAEGLFDGYNFNLNGLERLPESGSEIIVVNQPNTGPLRGNWFKSLVNFAIAESRGRQGNYEARWVQKEGSEKPFLAKTPLDIQRRRLAQMIHKSCNTILVDPKQSDRDKLKAVLEMKRHLTAGGVLVVCPEGRDSTKLKRGQEEAGQLVSMLATKLDVCVRPVGVWYKNGDLNVNFGEPVQLENSRSSGQKVADLAMVEIGRLLPRNGRGIYTHFIDRLNNSNASI